MTSPDFAPAERHGELRQLFDDVFFVSGAVRMSKPFSMTFSRNMTVIRHGETLSLINSMRLSEPGLAALDALGEVKNVLRLAAFHGLDDPFYKDRYGARVWAVKGSHYIKGFEPEKTGADAYFEPDVWMDADTELPIDDAKLVVIRTQTQSEGMLLLERHGGILVSGDCLQNWASSDAYFSFGAKVVMKLMGFFKPYNVGPGWLKGAKPDLGDVRGLLDLSFDHVLPAHGAEVIGGARDRFRPAIERLG